MLTLEQARQANAANVEMRPPASGSGPWSVFFGSFVIQGWHEPGRYTQYAHVDWVNPRIPYHAPKETIDEQGRLTGDLLHSPMLRTSVGEYRKSGAAAFMRAGEVIAETGMTGCGWGQRCYDFARFDEDGRPDFRGTNYPYYSSPHLHFLVGGRRAPKTRELKRFDPFGIEGNAAAGYPPSRSQWHVRMSAAKHQPLWLPQG